ncbi:MAG TPA: sigma-54-dependent Fis family transcriptional regulator [Bacillales bacterium]|nr:sigma-54-dependent Fis family transcriptional regulator [Bacillales bacterium]
MAWDPKLSTYEYSDFSSMVKKEWAVFIDNGQVSNKIRSEILHSWDRSKVFGVDPHKRKIEQIVKESDLVDNQSKNEKLLSIAQPDLKYLADIVSRTETIITISDNNGLLLEMYGDQQILKEGRKIHFMPGAIWNEEVGGTNAVGTVIKSRQPEQIVFSEHFCSGWQDWVCAAAPIIHPLTKELLGVLDISGKWKNVNHHTLGLAISKSHKISKMIGGSFYLSTLESNPFLRTAFDSFDDGVILIDSKKQILQVNQKMETLLQSSQLSSIEEWPELNKIVGYVLFGYNKNVEEEINFSPKNHKFICSVQQVLVDNNILGAAIRLRESKSLTKMNNNISTPLGRNTTTRYTFANMIGSSPSFSKVVKSAYKAAMLDSTLFLSGETGTGKEVFAQAIHQASKRNDKPFIAINCGAIPRDLIESELFGYEAGAFTGAKAKGSPGKFELAHGGTIFLDEIGDMPLTAQIHLLRILEEKMVTRIGSARPIQIDVRVIAATHKNLMAAVRKGEFREDLYFRLRVIQLRLPALRERILDIPYLVQHFIDQLSPQFEISNVNITQETMKCLQQYLWPGNIRELKNVIEQSLFNMEGDTLFPNDLPQELLEVIENPNESEKEKLIDAIIMESGSISKAANRLGISRATMYRKLKQYEIDTETFKENIN